MIRSSITLRQQANRPTSKNGFTPFRSSELSRTISLSFSAKSNLDSPAHGPSMNSYASKNEYPIQSQEWPNVCVKAKCEWSGRQLLRQSCLTLDSNQSLKAAATRIRKMLPACGRSWNTLKKSPGAPGVKNHPPRIERWPQTSSSLRY